MALRDTISSNTTALYKARTPNPRIVPQSAVWEEQEPNSYKSFGRKDKKVARQPINSSRMKKKAVVVGYEADAGFEVDITSQNVQSMAEEFLFALIRRKGGLQSVDIAADGFVVAAGGDSYHNGDLCYVSGTTATSTNLGLKLLDADGVAAKVVVDGLTADANAKVTLAKVGHQFAAGDASIAIVNGLPVLETVVFDMTTLGLLPGEQLFIGSDTAAYCFATEANMGWVRVKSIAAHAIVLDKTPNTFVADSGTGKTIRIYIGDALKNEADLTLQKALYVALRRQVGIADDATNTIQSELIVGNIADEMTIKIPEENKCTIDLTYQGRQYYSYDDDSTLDPQGTFVGVVEDDGFNSTNDIKQVRFWAYPDAPNSSPVPLIGAFTDFSIVFNNNISTNKAVSSPGVFAHTPGYFDVTLKSTGYFVDVAALAAMRDNLDLTFSFIAARANKGVGWDVPLVSASTDGLDIKINAPIMLDIDQEGADGRKYDPNFDHAIMMNFYAYLPDVACDVD